MLIREITTKISSKSKIDFFLSCASFEERTTAIVKNFDDDLKINTSFVFKYDEKDKTTLREENFLEMIDTLKSFSDKTMPIICNQHDPLDGISKLKERLGKLTMEKKVVAIDITTFTKQYLLVLLKYIEEMNPKSIQIYYSEPEDYSVKWDEPLSKGLIDIIAVPTYGGRFYSEKEDLLILLLGYEGNRSYGVWESINPKKTIILIGKPSYNPSWEGRVEKFNKALIEREPGSVEYVPTLRPFSVAQKLTQLIIANKEKYNIIISPLGPKPQTLGCYLSVRNHPQVQICYAIPKLHNEKYYSKKIGKMWEYEIPPK